jgi:hypothetical protein
MEGEMMATTREMIALLARTEFEVETNAGTYSAQDAVRAIGTADPAFAEYHVYETVGGARRTLGCDPAVAPGRARYINARELAAKRLDLARMRRGVQS